MRLNMRRNNKRKSILTLDEHNKLMGWLQQLYGHDEGQDGYSDPEGVGRAGTVGGLVELSSFIAEPVL